MVGLDCRTALRHGSCWDGGVDRVRVKARVKAALLGRAPPRPQIDRYEIRDLLGRGAMGVVYRAHDPDLDRDVALKVRRVPNDADARACWLAEGRALAQLEHPHVVGIYDAGIAGDEGYLAMELVDGHTLSQWLSAAKRSTAEIVAVLVAAGRGLSAAHHAGIVHRDFKPDNVLVGSDGRVRVADFGLASSGDVQLGSAAAGTPGYAAPEQLRGRAEFASDQFSYCVALVEALTGRCPGPDDPVGAGVPLRLRSALRRGLCADPRRRHVSMDRLVDMLCRPRRRWFGRVAPAVGLLAVVLGAGPRESSACPQPLTDARGEALAERLRGAGPLGASTWPRVDAALDDYTARWSDVRREVCHAQGSALAERRAACLDFGRHHVEALLDVLAHADASVVARAVRATADLPDPSLCAGDPPPLGEVDGPQLRAATRRVAKARAELGAGRPARAVETLAGDRTRFAAQSALVAAQAHLTLRDWGAAEAEALETIRTSRTERVEFGGWLVWMHAVGWGQQRYEEALRAARSAEATLHRMDDPGPHEGRYHEALGTLMLAMGDYAEAAERLERAVELLSDRRSASAMVALGAVYGRIGDNARELAVRRDALAALSDQLGPDHPDVAIARVGVGQALKHGGEYDQARAQYEAGVAGLTGAYGDDHRALAIPLLNLGNLELYVGRHERASEHHRRYRDIVAAAFPDDHPEHGRAAITLAESLLVAGKPEQAIAPARDGLRIAHAHFGPRHFRSAWARVTLGQAQSAAGHHETALHSLAEALAQAETIWGTDTAPVLDYMLAYAEASRLANATAAARALYQRAAEIAGRSGDAEAERAASEGLARIAS